MNAFDRRPRSRREFRPESLPLEGRALHARVANGAGALPAVIAALETNGLAVATATIARPSLDDVYLRHAGRAWQQTDSQEVAA